MNKLWVRLGLAFAGIALAGVAVVGVLANYQLTTGFHRYVLSNQVDARLAPALAAYYQANGGWAGVETVFENQIGWRGQRPGKGRGAPKYTLAAANGEVVYDETGQWERLSLAQRRKAFAITVDGETVGLLLVTPGAGQGAAEDAFLMLITRSLAQAGALAAALALLLGFLVARHLSAPLARLAQAARDLSRGDLSRRVPVSGSEEMIEVMTAFNDMAQALERSEASRRRMIADIAHELRTPLSVIQGNLQAMLDGVYPLSAEEVAQVYDQTLTLARLVEDLRALTQAEAGQLSLNMAEVEPAALLQSAAAVFKDAAREKNVQLKVVIAEGAPTMRADPDRVRQVLYNLLTNAIRHTPAGGRVLLEARPWRSPQGDLFTRVSVTDTGPGLTPEEQTHAFERFWRADASRSRDKGGSGLGLTIAKHLIEAQGGQIGVESQPGRGASFWFTIPALTPII
ncbi:MAG: HAMP domain-containing histidine kinase [Chloroflexi bacterium]|nr:HAMP domain-containing histidine kinase [Chloroflexota bacterium]